MARDRQRAKQRKARRRRARPRPRAASSPCTSDVPESLEHASGEVDEVDAALIAGADGEPPTPTRTAPTPTAPPGRRGRGALGRGRRRGRGRGRRGRPPARPPARATAPAAPPRPAAGGNRVINFLRASWAELQRVQWPDRRQVAQATAVVLGFVVIAGAYLGLADAVAQADRRLHPLREEPMFRWYVVNTYSGHENKVKQNLEHRAFSLASSAPCARSSSRPRPSRR